MSIGNFCVLNFIILTRITTSIKSEAQKLLINFGKTFTIEQCHTIKIKFDKIEKSRNL